MKAADIKSFFAFSSFIIKQILIMSTSFMTHILPQVLSIIYPSQYILSIYLSFHLSGAFHLCLHFHFIFTHSISTFYRNQVLHFFKSQKSCITLFTSYRNHVLHFFYFTETMSYTFLLCRNHALHFFTLQKPCLTLFYITETMCFNAS